MWKRISHVHFWNYCFHKNWRPESSRIFVYFFYHDIKDYISDITALIPGVRLDFTTIRTFWMPYYTEFSNGSCVSYWPAPYVHNLKKELKNLKQSKSIIFLHCVNTEISSDFLLWKFPQNSGGTVRFHKISTPGNCVKLWCFVQC